ncbi:hypothetical protein BS47DRAFT_1342384 [Hydnum rufescens UP504]|uniref:Peptidase A1 domain-containing protein n=1 Tax=Hydnum rufescens UP504 TaxID=1448309 RepID=A0A9P6B0Z4_9AGAM|nr:hypothetical protein BS47DRAFT_1342384 [Hydnum rufescens UP504]
MVAIRALLASLIARDSAAPPIVRATSSVVAPVFPADSFLAESSLGFSYHATLSLGADAKVNGGSGNTVQVLLDTGASADWVVWAGCTESVCSGHNVYHPSQQHFRNLSIHESLVYGDGGPANTISIWRVDDTVTFGSVSIPSTPFGAADSLPSSGESLDGNFGMARAYCGGHLCSKYPGFVETMYESGIIKAPALSFYQLAPDDVVPSGVQSSVAIGGVDRNKYIGTMDWFPLTDDSMWIIPNGLRYVTPGNNAPIVDATKKFTHTSLTLDTGDPELLGLPTNDWKTLVNLVGAQGPDSNGNYLFPCDATMTLNFRGTQNRDYTFTLVDPTTAKGNYCSPAANDAGNTKNWIMGSPFFDHYYTVWYFGDRGVHSTIGFGQKNLGASAAQSTPVIGYA